MNSNTDRLGWRDLMRRMMAHIENRYLKAGGRDAQEPGARRKSEYERRLEQALREQWQAQGARIERTLRAGGSVPELSDQALAEALSSLLAQATLDGAAQFGIAYDLDSQLYNVAAREFARTWAVQLAEDINKTTQETIANALADFVEKPGNTIGDVIARIQDAGFSAERAERIAVTEITRTFAEGNRIAGEMMEKEFPNVRVVEQWFTNRDGLVCAICRPLNGKTVGLHDDFAPGISRPPAHPNCRCWTDTYPESK